WKFRADGHNRATAIIQRVNDEVREQGRIDILFLEYTARFRFADHLSHVAHLPKHARREVDDCAFAHTPLFDNHALELWPGQHRLMAHVVIEEDVVSCGGRRIHNAGGFYDNRFHGVSFRRDRHGLSVIEFHISSYEE